MRKIIFKACFFLLFPLFLHAEIRETTRFDDLLQCADEETLVLIDMDDTLTDSSLSLGSSPWRHFLRQNFKGKKDPKTQIDIHDYYTYLAAKRIPVKTVEENTADVVATLQERGIRAICFTARGKNLWYSTTIEGIDSLTKDQLESVGIDFKKTSAPEFFNEEQLSSYSSGILFAADQPKGEFLKELFLKHGYLPKKVIMIDDKKEQLESLEMAMNEIGVPFLGIWYRHIEKSKKDFNPQIANVQLEMLLQKNLQLSDKDAEQIAPALPPEEYLKAIVMTS